MPKGRAPNPSGSEIPFIRRRLLPEQVATLQEVFQAKSHPSPEERAELAAELGLELKAVNVWYQNKRRSVKKQTLAWKPGRPGGQVVSRNTLSWIGRSLNRKTTLSLDSVVEARERPNPIPQTPRRPSPHTAAQACSYIWERIPSSPIIPPSSPSADSVRLSALPATSKARKSLEFACAKDRAGWKKRRRRHGVRNMNDVPPLPSLDISVSRTETDTEVEEAITPDTSMELAQLCTPVRKREFVEGYGLLDTKENEPPFIPKDVEAAAIALLGFRVPT